MIAWILLLTITFGHQQVRAGVYPTEELCQADVGENLALLGKPDMVESAECIEGLVERPIQPKTWEPPHK